MHYYWLPFKDEGWHNDIVKLGKLDTENIRILPFEDLKSGDAHKTPGLAALPGAWNNIQGDDHVFVVGHGHNFTTDKISWKLNDPAMPPSKTWSVTELADNLATRLRTLKKANLTIHVYACFSGNNITICSKSFGKKLAKKLKPHGFNGRVIGYKGAIGMLKARGHQTGSSRLTAAPHFLCFGSGPDMRGKATHAATIAWVIS